jgi:ubiquinone/menaquinone biosynthesis C-methylase UbiE/uncharacterized protein YbaR (Trm112 family)
MREADIDSFSCLSCKSDLKILSFESSSDGNIKNGVIFCDSCKTVYLINEFIPFLLEKGYYQDYFDIDEFIRNHQNKFDFNNYKVLDRRIIPNNLNQSNFYNEDSKNYDELVMNSTFWRAVDANIFNVWLDEAPDKDLILDIGCGTGRCSMQLAKKSTKVFSTDISAGMLQHARKKAEAEGIDNIVFFLADAEDLPLKNNIFSMVTSYGMLHHVSDPEAVIQGAQAALKNGGLLYALENNASPLRPVFDMLMSIWKLWNEEAGSHPTFRAKELRKSFEKHRFKTEMRTSIFIPPHLCYFMSFGLTCNILSNLDKFFNTLPVLKNCGGHLLVKAVKTV